jgi:hypothetical protein
MFRAESAPSTLLQTPVTSPRRVRSLAWLLLSLLVSGMSADAGCTRTPAPPARGPVHAAPPPAADAADAAPSAAESAPKAFCPSRLAVTSIKALGPASPDRASPDGQWRLRFERVPGARSAKTPRGLEHPQRWRVTLSAANGSTEQWLLGSAVDEAQDEPAFSWGEGGQALVAWRDRSPFVSETRGCCDRFFGLDAVRSVVVGPGIKPKERNPLRDAGSGDLSIVNVRGSWWLYSVGWGEIARVQLNRAGLPLRADRCG